MTSSDWHRAGLAIVAASAIASVALLQAQGRGVGEWTTSGFDAQRTAWVKSDLRLTKAAVQKGTFQFLWQAKFDNESRQLNSLTEPVLQDLLIGYRGFKTLAFLGGSADRLFAIDTDLARPYWTVHVNYGVATGGPPPSSWECPGGLMATPSRRTVLARSTFASGGGGGRGGRAASAVGEPGKGAAVLSQPRPQPRPTPPATPPVAPRTGDAVPTATRPASGAAANPIAASPTAAGRTTSGAVAPIPFGGVDPLYILGSDGLLRTLRVSDGAEIIPPVPFLPPSARPSSLIYVDGVVYTSTSNGCGAAPNAVWAMDLRAPGKKAVSWQTGGAGVVGTAGPAFGTDGTLYVALGSAGRASAGSAGTPASGGSALTRPSPGTDASTSTDGQGAAASHANAVVALDRHTLAVKDWFTAGAAFTTSPIVIRHQDKDLIAATASDGRLYLLDSASLGGADHKTPLFATPKYTGTGTGSGASASRGLATWDDGATRWILAPAIGVGDSGVKLASPGPAAPRLPLMQDQRAVGTGKVAATGPAARGRIVAFRLVDAGGRTALAPGWESRDLVSPLAPIVVNGLVMAASSGEYLGESRDTGTPLTAAQRAQRSTPAVLYVLDGTTGKELWSSGKTITSFARAGLSAGGGQVYLVTYDNRLYAFGIPMEH